MKKYIIEIIGLSLRLIEIYESFVKLFDRQYLRNNFMFHSLNTFENNSSYWLPSYFLFY